MNTAKSVVYGWGVLIVAGAGAYYYARKDIDARRKDQQYRGARPTEQLTWRDRIGEFQQPPANGADPSRTGVTGTIPGQVSVEMRSAPTGVDTVDKAASSIQQR